MLSLSSRSSTHSRCTTRRGCSILTNASGISSAGVAIIAARPNPAQSMPAPTPAGEPANRPPAVAPSAAMRTSPSRPIPRSISTTVVASVFDPAAGAVSAMRMTSPPILLGRKLLKKVATRNEDVSLPNVKSSPCAFSSSPQRQVLIRTTARYRASAATSHGADAWRATLHRRARSTRENSNHRRATLTAALRADIDTVRVRVPPGCSLSLVTVR